MRKYTLKPSPVQGPSYKASLNLPPDFFYSIPKAISLRKYCTPVRDQGSLGCCSGMATAAALETLQAMVQNVPNPTILSPLFLYYIARELEGTLPADDGAALSTLMLVTTLHGAAPESDWKFSLDSYDQQPKLTSLAADANKNRARGYLSIGSLDELKHSIATGMPVVVGLNIPVDAEDFTRSSCTLKRGMVNDAKMGGHAVLAVGYDDIRQVVEIKNSWGPGWGDDGYFFLSYDAYHLVVEAWTLYTETINDILARSREME